MASALRRHSNVFCLCVCAFVGLILGQQQQRGSDQDPFVIDPVQQQQQFQEGSQQEAPLPHPAAQFPDLQRQQPQWQAWPSRREDKQQQQQQLHTSEGPTAVNNAAPLDLNLCSDSNYRLVDSLPGGLRRSTEVRTLQLGQSGVIWPMSNRSIPFNVDCLLQLSACSACQILISWNPLPAETARSFPSSSSSIDQQQGNPLDRDGPYEIKTPCETVWDFRDRMRCVDLRLIESDADQTTLKPYQRLSMLNPPAEYRTQFLSSSYKLDLNLQFWRGDAERANALRQLFPLKYVVIDNTRLIRGRPSPADLPTNFSDGFIASPRFPKTYPEGVTVNYTLVNDDPEGSVRLIFTDFRLHYMSILKIIDSNGQEIANTQSQYGISQRPSAIQSSGNTLTIIFTANNYKREIGFRANYRFVKEKSWLGQPSPKSCDKVFEDAGGTITIENLNLDAFTYVDCIWILEKPRYAPIGFDKLYLKVEDFSVNSGGKGVQLDVHLGRTSINRRILTIFGPKSSEQLAREQPQEGFISDSSVSALSHHASTIEEDDSDTGFYLRLRGFLGSSNGMDISFAQFYRWATAICHDMTEFHCDNGRCISNRYQCDAHDHCGDFSDEIKCQNRRIDGSRGRMFPGPGEVDPEPPGFPLGSYTTTILLVSGLIGLILVLLMVTIIVARVYRHKLIRRFASASAHGGGDHGDDVISGLSTSHSIINRSSSGIVMAMDDQLGTRPAPSMHQVGNRRLLVLPESEIGVLEAPPTYDDAMKHPTVPPSASLHRLSTIGTPSTIPAISGIGSANTSATASPPYEPSGEGPSTAIVAAAELPSTSFDNPAFESGADANDPSSSAIFDGRVLASLLRPNIRSRSAESTCSSTSSSGGESSGASCTGSDLDTVSDGEPAQGQSSVPSGHPGLADSTPSTDYYPSSLAAAEQVATTEGTSTNLGSRRPPVPLPRSSRLSHQFGTAGAPDPAPAASSSQALNDTLV